MKGSMRSAPPLLVDDPASTYLTDEEAAAAAHVGVETIRTWAKRGKLTRYGQNPVRYQELQVLQVEMATRRAPRLARLLDEAATFEP